MAGWLEGVRVGMNVAKSKGFLEIALLFFAICTNLPTTSYAQPGFLSIDCGSTLSQYTDSLQLEWVTDNGTYIKTGKSFQLFFPGSNAPEFNSSAGGNQALLNLRYFPERRNKHCYELPTNAGISYLIRASFYLPQSELWSRQPFEFILSINATNWFTIASGDVNSEYDLLIAQEGIFYSPGKVLYFCLQPVVGMPFISSLELRPLDATMYSYVGSHLQYLALLFRYNLGALVPTPAVRFPDDLFDRVWQSTAESWYPSWPIISSPILPGRTTRADVNNVPPKVMQDAWLFSSPDQPVSFPLYPYEFYPHQQEVNLNPKEYAYAVVYVENLNTSSGANSMNVNFGGVYDNVVNFSNQANMQATPFLILYSDFISIALSAPPNSTTVPTLNAVEVYAQYNFNFSTTATLDDEATTTFKTSFSLTDWQGDPCTPVPHDWLSCDTDSSQQGSQGLRSSYYVTAVNLTNRPTSGFGFLTDKVSTDFGRYSVTNMTIINCGVDSQAFQFLVKYFLSDTFSILDLSYNAIDTVPPENSWPIQPPETFRPLLSLSVNLSHNLLTGVNESLPRNLIATTLNLSHNALTSLPVTWVSSVNVLDLSHNQLQGKISSLAGLLLSEQKRNDLATLAGLPKAPPLEELYLSDNNLSGTFSSFDFSQFQNLKIAIFDRNSIQGTLNLSSWYDGLQLAASGNKSSSIDPHQLFSFVDNNILDIVPNAKTFESVEGVLSDDSSSVQHGILLGGNPYCNGAKSYIQQYLCRSSLNDEIEKHGKKNKDVIVIGICVGVFVFLVFCGILASMWNLWRQVYTLQKIQQALARQKVQPPFYDYSDLKLATKNFHKDSKLGHGGFGIVYKGMLADKTMVAVKKLFDSQKSQVLSEFLNEVVLITGIRHKNLTQLKGCCIKDKQRILVYEYVDNGNVSEALWGSKPHGDLNWAQRFNICVGLARGLSYLHEELTPSIIHRDIKPENILLDKNFRPKIADFGLAKHLSEGSSQAVFTKIAGTLGYFSPEYAMQGQLSEKLDVYSYGIVVLEIISGRKCIDSSLPPERRFLTNWVHEMRKRGLLLHVLQPKLKDNCVVDEVIRAVNIGLLCVQVDPERRPSMSQVVTMLLGNMDVNVSLDDPKNDQLHPFQDLLVTGHYEKLFPNFQNVIEEEEVDEHPLLDRYSQFDGSSTSGKRNLGCSVQMSGLAGSNVASLR